MYEVNINADPEDFLDWDRPLSEQPQIAARLGLSTRHPDEINAEAYEIMMTGPGGKWMDDPAKVKRVSELQSELDNAVPDQTGEMFYRNADSDTYLHGMLGGNKSFRSRTEELRDAGIPGIRYLDAGSRGAGDGSRNYVVFDENLITIVRKYGIAGAAALLGVSAQDVQAAIQGQGQE
jgi:hypothetical protein